MSNDTKHLLLIEDDEHYREVLSRALNRRGFQVASAPSASEAMDICHAYRPQYIILDLNLNGQSGLNLIQPLLAIVPAARILILTGYASIPTVVSAIKLGATQYLAKPADVADIIRALQNEPYEPQDLLVNQRMTVQHLEWEYIQRILAEHGGNITATARALKMHRRTLQRKLFKRSPAT
jgi:two-component system response regulator RegA